MLIKDEIVEKDGETLLVYRVVERPLVRKVEFKGNEDAHEKMARRREEGGCWVDYATVFYWYQDDPAGFEHQPLESVPERIRALQKSSRGEDG